MQQPLLLRLILFCVFIWTGQSALATHNRAGEITYEQIGDLTIRATITTYTKASSIPADRDSLEICWGDGDCEWVIRENGPDFDGDGFPDGELLPNDIKVNFYIAEHTYAGISRYTISMNDRNRNGGICNVNFPGSDQIPFHLQTTVTFFNPQFQGYNNSPILTNAPIDIGCIGQKFLHNPGAYDPDGDSLAYRLIVPLEDLGDEVPSYKFPNEIEPGANNNIFFDQRTGDFCWDAPQKECEYNIAFYVIEYRNGVAVDTLIRDMQILIESCDNRPPEIEVQEEICVIAGELLELEVVGTAPLIDVDQKVELTAQGGPFEVDISPAEFIVSPGFQDQPNTALLRWQTECEHINKEFYTVVFRAIDNFPILSQGTNSPDTSFLSTIKILKIKVVGPPPEDVQAEAESNMVTVSWESPYACEVTENNYFRGFTVWRRIGSNPFPIDTCTPGLDGRGYTEITLDPTQQLVNGRYQFVDDDVERGRTYCYRVLAEFARSSAGSFPFNFVESLPSKEVCVQLSRDVPLMTNVSITETDVNNGEIFVAWVKPDAEDLDTLLNPGPYVYEVERATGITQTGFQPIGVTFTANNFSDPVDTSFTDTGLNTLENAYSYRLALTVNNEPEPLGFAAPASSVFLTVASTDEQNDLSWDFDVPWENLLYRVFRLNGQTGDFEEIAEVIEPMYSDEELINGEEYCYYIEAEGDYRIDGVPAPLINLSQEACGIPLDTIPPCRPQLEVENICNQGITAPEDAFINNLTWTNPNNQCVETNDAVGYNIYYTREKGGVFDLIETYRPDAFDANDTTYMHQPEIGIAGCYAVSAVDSLGNESLLSDSVCVDNCPLYELPNVFTPNGDGTHDEFLPFPYRFIERIDMKIFNRWGQIVFETTNPDILWDGTNQNGDQLAEGAYFYSCVVFEQRLTGVSPQPEILSGYIQLIRGR